jgi:hypothetical protein
MLDSFSYSAVLYCILYRISQLFAPKIEGFLDNLQSLQKQMITHLRILPKNGGMECSGAWTLIGLRLVGCCQDVLQWKM